jgi:RecB family exonuclease
VSDGSPGGPPATALDRQKIAHWRQAGRYRDETVAAIAELACGEKVLERLSSDQVTRVAWLLELAVAGRVSQRTLAGAVTRARSRARSPAPAAATSATRAPGSSSLAAAEGRRGRAPRPAGGCLMAAAGRQPTATVGASPLEVPARLPLRSDDTRLMYLSVSSLALFSRCPERWRRRYLERQPEPQRGAMVVGKAVGATIAAHFAAKMAGEALSAGEADDLCAAEFDERAAQPLTDFGQDNPGELREQAREALRAYQTELAPAARPVSVGRRFELRFEGADWSIVGYLDIEDASGEVIDVKVGSKHVSEARAKSDPQPTVYELARRAEGRREGRFLFHSLRRGAIRSGERCLVVPAPRAAAQLTAMEFRIGQTARQIARCAETGDWPLSSPEGWWCSRGQCVDWSGCLGGGVAR